MPPVCQSGGEGRLLSESHPAHLSASDSYGLDYTALACMHTACPVVPGAQSRDWTDLGHLPLFDPVTTDTLVAIADAGAGTVRIRNSSTIESSSDGMGRVDRRQRRRESSICGDLEQATISA